MPSFTPTIISDILHDSNCYSTRSTAMSMNIMSVTDNESYASVVAGDLSLDSALEYVGEWIHLTK